MVTRWDKDRGDTLLESIGSAQSRAELMLAAGQVVGLVKDLRAERDELARQVQGYAITLQNADAERDALKAEVESEAMKAARWETDYGVIYVEKEALRSRLSALEEAARDAPRSIEAVAGYNRRESLFEDAEDLTLWATSRAKALRAALGGGK